MNLAEVLKVLRGDRSLRDMEKLSGLSNAYWYQMESGFADNPSIETVQSLIKTFPNHREVILNSVGLGLISPAGK